MITLHNSTLRVTLNKTTFAIAVTDRRSGARWHTPGAGFALQVYDVACHTYRWYPSVPAAQSGEQTWYLTPAIGHCDIQLAAQDQTRAAGRVEFAGLGLGFSVELKLLEDRLELTIPTRSWNYAGEKANEVISVDCLPLFGSRPRGSKGYLVLPHFGGALRYFADRRDRAERMAGALAADSTTTYATEMDGNRPDPHAPQTYTGLTYGLQTNWRDLIAYPLWGTIVGESSWAAYVPFGCGDCDTGIVTSSNQGPANLCAAHARFYFREHVHDRRVDEDRKLVLTFLHGRDLNYATVGRLYRRYLIKTVGVPTLRQKAAASPETENLVSGYWLKPMLALKRYSYLNNPNPDGKGILDVYLTCDQMAKELRRWKKAGVRRALVQVVGANSEGHDGNYPTYFPLEPKIGGEEGFRQLLAVIRKLGYRSSVHVDIRLAYKAAPDFRPDPLVRDRDGGWFFEQSGPGGDGWSVCPLVGGPEFVAANFPRLKALGLDGGMYTDFMLGVLFRCYDPMHPLTRRGYLDAVKAYLKQSKEFFGATRTEAVIAPLLDVVDAVARILALGNSENWLRSAELTARGLADEVVPLQAVVFHGIIVYVLDSTCMGQRDPWASVLRNVALGAKPVEELRGSHAPWDDLHAIEYRVLCERMGWLQYEFIENIERRGQATRTVYADGTVVWVNHGRKPVKVDGRKVPGRGFRVRPGKKTQKEFRVEEHRTITNREPLPTPDGHIWPDGRPREGAALRSDGPLPCRKG